MPIMKEGLLAVGGILGAIAASSCCILPLVFVSVGIGGAWVGNLTVLGPYQPLFIALAVICLGAGFWLVYRPPQGSCANDSGAHSGLGRLVRSMFWVKVALWLGALLVTLAVGAGYGGALFL